VGSSSAPRACAQSVSRSSSAIGADRIARVARQGRRRTAGRGGSDQGELLLAAAGLAVANAAHPAKVSQRRRPKAGEIGELALAEDEEGRLAIGLGPGVAAALQRRSARSSGRSASDMARSASSPRTGAGGVPSTDGPPSPKIPSARRPRPTRPREGYPRPLPEAQRVSPRREEPNLLGSPRRDARASCALRRRRLPRGPHRHRPNRGRCPR
jgi:hypothetical protein